MNTQKETQNHWYRHIPNFLTLLNLISGSISIVMALTGESRVAGILLLIAFHCDIFDGMAARLLKVQSAIGKELDSLADVVSFGLAPAAILYMLGLQNMGYANYHDFNTVTDWVLGLSPLLIPAFAALRLAKFNLDPEQGSRFIGVPTPANALLVLVIPLMLTGPRVYHLEEFFTHLWYVPVYSVLISALMVSPIPLYSLKLKGFGWSANRYTYAFLLLILPIIILFWHTGLYFTIWFYIIYAVILEWLLSKKAV